MSVAYPDEMTLTQEVADTITDSFHHLMYASGVWERTFWRGKVVIKCPTDLFIYQEIIHATRPDYIVETGTYAGGAALFFADIMELAGHGKVITIDKSYQPDRPQHHRIHYVEGNSLAVFDEVKELIEGVRGIVSLDSDHQKAHVLAEMELYAPLATEYLVVEDTNIGHPICVAGFEEGPMEAVQEFLETHPEFEIDRGPHKFLVTFNPDGWLRRVYP